MSEQKNIELPPLPEPEDMDYVRWAYSAEAMRSYAEDAVAAALVCQSPSLELTNEQIAAGAAILGDDGRPVGRNTAIMVADAMFPRQSPAPIPEQVAKAETNESAEHEEIKTWPERIYLQCENEHGDGVEPYGTAGQEITWGQDCISKFDVEYVRADLAPTTSTVSASGGLAAPEDSSRADEDWFFHPNDD